MRNHESFFNFLFYNQVIWQQTTIDQEKIIIKNISYKAFLHDGSTLIFYYCGLKKPLALPAFPYTFVKTLTNCLYAQVRNDLLHKRWFLTIVFSSNIQIWKPGLINHNFPGCQPSRSSFWNWKAYTILPGNRSSKLFRSWDWWKGVSVLFSW